MAPKKSQVALNKEWEARFEALAGRVQESVERLTKLIQAGQVRDNPPAEAGTRRTSERTLRYASNNPDRVGPSWMAKGKGVVIDEDLRHEEQGENDATIQAPQGAGRIETGLHLELNLLLADIPYWLQTAEP